MQRCIPIPIRGVHLSAAPDQELNHLPTPKPRRDINAV